MNRFAIAAALLVAGSALPAAAQDWDWSYDQAPAAARYAMDGPGVPMLLPELRDNPRGRAFVLNNFDRGHDGFITPPEAAAANRAFAEIAGTDPTRFDWARHRPAEVVAVPVPVPADDGGWDRAGMRAYRFHQAADGAVFSMSDVLFKTGSAELRPGAEAKLRPLAGFLRANPDVRLRIDGNTDSVGSAEANVQLSRDRADSVASALQAMGVDGERFRLEGHGEDNPVASNATAEGRQLNRRVEVTLLGQRADSFG